MSHEFRTPLSNILAAAGLLSEEVQDARAGERVNQIRHSAYILLGMVEDALDVARVESGQLQLFAAPFDPRAVVQDVAEQMRSRAENKGLGVQLAFDESLPEHVRGDAFRLRQILVNLVDNAIKFTDRGAVTVRLAAEKEGWLRMEVEDTGRGIPPQSRERMFDAFVQGPAEGAANGAGLGLAICRNLAQALGGSILLEGAAQGGCLFVVRLPFPAWQRDGKQPDEVNILLVEDDALGRELIETILRHAGYEVTSVGDGARALVLASQANFSLLLVDVRLPGISGPEMVRHLRSAGGRLGRVPILALTADALPEQRDECFRAGMNDFITKPVEVDSLVASVKKWLGGPRPDKTD